jgi:hypothetical protein
VASSSDPAADLVAFRAALADTAVSLLIRLRSTRCFVASERARYDRPW